MFGIPKEIRQMVERCIRDREGRIVGYLAGYSNAELQSLLRRHASEGWHVSYAKIYRKRIAIVLQRPGISWFLFCQNFSTL